MKTKFFKQRRQAVLAAMPAQSVALISSGQEQIRNKDVEYPFRPQSDFYYLTGFNEPDATLVLIKTHKNSQAWLFLREKDALMETWQGRRLGVKLACHTLKMSKAFANHKLDKKAASFLKNMEHLYFSFDAFEFWSPQIQQWLGDMGAKSRQGIYPPSNLHNLNDILHEMRLIKSTDEIKCMRQAAQISVKGHLAAMQSVKPGKMEYQVQADLENGFKQAGSPRLAFDTIVASGNNACILHYTENQDKIQDNQLVLVDAGAEYKGYAGDITTTFPASGQFTEAQAQLYTLVLNAQKAAIKMARPGQNYEKMHLAAAKVITQGLLDLNILKGEFKTLLKKMAYKKYFMHGTGHWLGCDVHDVGKYKIAGQWIALQSGMVVTVEPGLYIPLEDKDVASQWRGIGIRIEDDILVTDGEPEILTQGLPRTVKEIETWMANRSFPA